MVDPNVRYKWTTIAKIFGACLLAPILLVLAIYCYRQGWDWASFFLIVAAIIEWVSFLNEPETGENEK